jgi:hypothetical protein
VFCPCQELKLTIGTLHLDAVLPLLNRVRDRRGGEDWRKDGVSPLVR